MMKQMQRAALTLVAAVGALTVTVVPAKADTVSFSNLNAKTIDADSLATYGPIAGSFSTAEYGTTLNQVSVKLIGTADAGSVTMRLLSDAALSPGAVVGLVGTVNDSAFSSALANYSLMPASQLRLSANTRYWIQLTSNASSASWAWSQDISGPGVAREYIANSNGIFANAAEAPYQMQVVTATPEPSTYGVLGLGLVAVALLGRKRITL